MSHTLTRGPALTIISHQGWRLDLPPRKFTDLGPQLANAVPWACPTLTMLEILYELLRRDPEI